ncbi:MULTISPECIES: S9 family peptidase [Gammaproteobacteria]|uniref:alpha/beta hydrolase family protein n=1 Tax=Gammaproteobacteria TaxID=1236 RepID=UPI000DCFD977|nr:MULTISPECIES: S9 family peptidase [Gammaproteobacteria]RTE85578.1 S9 family peptidase [Aliidiomarina sp. B3213]TCZ89548.1 S9 family peptidase [Lysobacter sp. N42]
MQFLVRVTIVLAMLVVSRASYAQEIPLENFFKEAEFSSVAISPTGKYIAVSTPGEDRRNLAVIDMSDPANLKVTAAFNMRGGESPIGLRWVTEERLLFESMIQIGALERPQGTGRVYAINADGSERNQLFGTQAGSYVGRQMSIMSYMEDEPEWVLIQHWAHDNPRPVAQRMNINDGRLGMRTTSPLERGGLLADQQDRVRFAYGQNDRDKPVFSWRASEDSEWIEFENEFGQISPIAFTESGTSIYFYSRESDRLGVYEIDLLTQQISPVAEHDRVELDTQLGLSPFIFDNEGNDLLAVRFMDGIPEWVAVDQDAFEVQWLRQLENMYQDYYVHIHNWTEDGKQALVSVRSASTPPDFFILDTETPELRFFASATPWLDPSQMASVQPISFNARDGQEIHGYMTLPNDYVEGESIPFVVYVHGGPHGPRDSWSYESFVQVFAHHGFGVLQVNYRGSGGYGVDFEEMGYREWYGKMQDDVTDGTLWAMEQGYADEERTCIAGASYGGFATLAGITKEPDLYACAWAFVGVYDLPLMKEEGNIPSFAAGRRYLDRVLGTDQEELIARSPTTHVGKITTPLFVSHGAEDTQAHFGQYHLLLERLDEEGIPYESLFVEGEGHGFYKVENNVMQMERVLEFMKEHTE